MPALAKLGPAPVEKGPACGSFVAGFGRTLLLIRSWLVLGSYDCYLYPKSIYFFCLVLGYLYTKSIYIFVSRVYSEVGKL